MPSDNVILVGFMGVGKSTGGRLLARRLGRCFVETDDMITAREGCAIPEIFARHGEARFRQLEAEAVSALGLKSGDVLTAIGERKITSVYDLTDVLNERKAGDVVQLKFLRDGKEQTAEATLVERRSRQ